MKLIIYKLIIIIINKRILNKKLSIYKSRFNKIQNLYKYWSKKNLLYNNKINKMKNNKKKMKKNRNLLSKRKIIKKIIIILKNLKIDLWQNIFIFHY